MKSNQLDVNGFSHKADGSSNKLKARVVAKGSTQSYGTNYKEAFALSPTLPCSQQ